MAKLIVIGNSERIVHFYGQAVTPTMPVEFDDPEGKLKKSAEQETFLEIIDAKEAKEKKEESPKENTTGAGWNAPAPK